LGALLSQVLESEKLTLTAALHLDRIRRFRLESAGDGPEVEKAKLMVDQSLSHIHEVHARAAFFLRITLRFVFFSSRKNQGPHAQAPPNSQKLRVNVAAINDHLDELIAEMAESDYADGGDD